MSDMYSQFENNSARVSQCVTAINISKDGFLLSSSKATKHALHRFNHCHACQTKQVVHSIQAS
jgi:hypothetical protein